MSPSKYVVRTGISEWVVVPFDENVVNSVEKVFECHIRDDQPPPLSLQQTLEEIADKEVSVVHSADGSDVEHLHGSEVSDRMLIAQSIFMRGISRHPPFHNRPLRQRIAKRVLEYALENANPAVQEAAGFEDCFGWAERGSGGGTAEQHRQASQEIEATIREMMALLDPDSDE